MVGVYAAGPNIFAIPIRVVLFLVRQPVVAGVVVLMIVAAVLLPFVMSRRGQ